MIFGDHQLFLVAVGVQLDDLHPVQQGSGHRVQGIRRGDKHHIGQVKGNFQIMVPIGMVLLRVQHFQQGGAGVPPVIGAHLINFIQQQHRIGGAGLGHGSHDPSGHGAHIGLPVAPDVRFIMDAAQGDPNHFPVQAPGDGIGNGGFAHTGRSYQAQDLGGHLGCQLPDGDGFQNALLHLFQTEVVVLQDL